MTSGAAGGWTRRRSARSCLTRITTGTWRRAADVRVARRRRPLRLQGRASGPGLPKLIPPYLIDVDPEIGETAADNRYVSVDGAR